MKIRAHELHSLDFFTSDGRQNVTAFSVRISNSLLKRLAIFRIRLLAELLPIWRFNLTHSFVRSFGIAVGVMFIGVQACLASTRAYQDEPDAATANADDEEFRFFEETVRPLLNQRCVSCHGPETQEGGLRLDHRDFAFEGGDRGAVIVPSNPDDSRLLKVVSGEDDEVEQMPPDGEGTPLSQEEIASLRIWIANGAMWPGGETSTIASDHWSFQSVSRPATPMIDDGSWVQNPIDAFVLEKLLKRGVAPAEIAERHTLVRRLYLDLLGLPPTVAEVDAFINDQSPNAYDRLVERVLASPHFGERWGRHWLDLARYADSDGYEKDRPRPNAWRYRQWVIDSINADQSFDQFSQFQIAGDMMERRGPTQLAASGFHRNTLHNTEGGTDQEEDRFKKTIDRTNTVGSIWLGLTVGCAQCHTHKFDPISHREYYSLFAYFNQMDEANVPAPTSHDQLSYQAAIRQYELRHAQLAASLKQYEESGLAEAQRKWETASQGKLTQWNRLEVHKTIASSSAQFEVSDDGRILVVGENASSDVYRIEVTTPDDPITAIRLEVLADERLPKNGPGRAQNGNFVLADFKLFSGGLDQLEPGPSIKLDSAKADFSQQGFEVSNAITEDPANGWAVSPQMGRAHRAVFELQEPTKAATETLTIELNHRYPNDPHNLGCFRLSWTNSPSPVSLDDVPEEIVNIVATTAKDRTPEQSATLARYFENNVDQEYQRLSKALADHQATRPNTDQYVVQAVTQRAQPRTTHVHLRGDFLRPDQVVEERTPRVFDSLVVGEAPQDRLALAEWFFDQRQPLTSRVTVNRIWSRLFGRGLVPTIDDFGTQGDQPSHPELLDWLASELVEQGWSVKEIVRTIVTSSTYQQRSDIRTELIDQDPENELLARQTRRRVEAEVIRDLSLRVSGLLDHRIGGPSVRPPQPSEYSKLTYANSAKWETSQGGDAYRRGIYTFFQRTSPYPMLTIFDCPDSNQTIASRNASNTAIQSLTLWNDVVFFDCARNFAQRIMAESSQTSGSDRPSNLEDQIQFAFLCSLARRPSDREVMIVRELHHDHIQQIQENAGSLDAILGDTVIPANAERLELAAWVLTARTLLNLDEFIVVD